MLAGLIGGLGALGSGVMSAITQGDNNSANRAMQEEFAQNGVQWRVADAQKAGISPLAALGVNIPSFQSLPDPMGNLDNDINDMGQDISRAVMSTQAQQDQDRHALNLKMIQGADIDNALKSAQLRKLQAPGANAVPLAYVKVKNYDGTISIVPSKEAEGAGFFPASRYNWDAQNFLPGVPGEMGLPHSSTATPMDDYFIPGTSIGVGIPRK